MPHPIEIYFKSSEDTSVLTLDAFDITSMTSTNLSQADKIKYGEPFLIKLTTDKNIDKNPHVLDNGQFPTRLEYARAAERAFDDPICAPSRAMATASKGTHSMGLSLDEVEAIARSMLIPLYFNIAKANADLSIPAASAYTEFLSRNATPPQPSVASAPPEIDFARARSRSAYPAKNDTTLESHSEPDPLNPKPSL